MIVKRIEDNKKYVRKVESMGIGLVLFKVSVADKKIGRKYHLFYADGRKPPLDISIDPCDETVEYVSCFAQDEVIKNAHIDNDITNKGVGIKIIHKDFNEDNMHITEVSQFAFFKSEDDIWILRKDVEGTTIAEYGINELNSLLFDNNKFCGMVLRKLSQEEFQEIRKSKCLE